MDSEGVLLRLIHEHSMIPCNDLRKGDCCGRFEATSDGYYCKTCDFFVHKKCVDEASESIEHPSHPGHTLQLLSKQKYRYCNLCGRDIKDLCYHHDNFDVDLYCAKYPPPEVIESSETPCHKLTLLKEKIEFHCDAKCEEIGYGFPYKCLECGLTFHIDCVWDPSGLKYLPEVIHPLDVKNHSCHPLHPLKLVLTGQLPDYSDGKCRLCEKKIDSPLFYHCSPCNFTLDMRCALNPPSIFFEDSKTHDHQLTLLPRLDSFTCNACGLKGDRSPYICVQCNFIIHQECLTLPRLININRHDHRVSRTNLLGLVNSVCGVCRQKVDWTWGGYSCQRCSNYVVHSKCATRKDVWNGKELEGVIEETEDIEPYVEIDDNTIQHFSHGDHYLKLDDNGVLCDENKRCSACTHSVCLESFYGCMDCDFILHQKCAKFPKRKRHVLHNERLTLFTREAGHFWCNVCGRISNGFSYQYGDMKLDVICCSVLEPFVHPSHPDHPLYYISPEMEEVCNGCNMSGTRMLRCIEDGCGFVLCFKCATLPQVLKHRVDDYPLSLCYGEKANGIYWCEICEKKMNPEKWFYTCKDQWASLHTECVVGDFSGLMPGSVVKAETGSYEVVLNKNVSRPFCRQCKSHCMYPIIYKIPETSDSYLCSDICIKRFTKRD
ncbi:DC1 [Arabidopsis suecica]|uniref:DC1 n=1 Tax=Arabidopsis suecica TaxID=45249 RepID=A0A8T2E5I1_ARASU|nr:DC1 [Arabidopsis suecica]